MNFQSLSTRSRNVLARAGISTFEQLAAASDFKLLSTRGCGKTALREIRRFQSQNTDVPPRNGPGELHVGANEKGEVVINLPHDMTGHICFTPHQARHLAVILLRQAAAAAGEPFAMKAWDDLERKKRAKANIRLRVANNGHSQQTARHHPAHRATVERLRMDALLAEFADGFCDRERDKWQGDLLRARADAQTLADECRGWRELYHDKKNIKPAEMDTTDYRGTLLRYPRP